MSNEKNVTIFRVSDAGSGFMVGHVWLTDPTVDKNRKGVILSRLGIACDLNSTINLQIKLLKNFKEIMTRKFKCAACGVGL